MKEQVEKMLGYLTKLTKDEADFVEHVLKWDNDLKTAFFLAKTLLDEENK